MRIETAALTGASAGTRREVTLYRYGTCGAGRKVYLQAGLHADEMPGVLVLQHLMVLLDEAEARGQIAGEVLVVPAANPIGLSQWAFQRPLGRHEADSLHNFNRGYPELARLVGDRLEGALTASAEENLHLIRAAFRAALAEGCMRDDRAEQMVALMNWSCDADYVLDLHCDHFAVLHLYASSARPQDTDLLCRSIGAKLALIEDLSGGHAFDEAHTVPWAQLRDRYGDRFPIPAGCFSTTLEYRGQFDVEDGVAAADAGHLMTFLAAIGVVTDRSEVPAHPAAVERPLAGAAEVFAPQGGVVTWAVPVGAEVEGGQVLAHVTDPVSRRRLAVVSPVSGMLFRCELWRSCLRGQSLAHVAGEKIVRSGDLLSD
jgi:predicted deacylase